MNLSVILVKKSQEGFQDGFGIFGKKNFSVLVCFTQKFYIKLFFQIFFEIVIKMPHTQQWFY